MEKKVRTEGSAIPDSWFRSQAFASPILTISSRINDPRIAPLGEGERRLGPFVLPPFQRPPVWTVAQKVRFIESIWMGLPIGSYVVNVGGYGSRFDDWLLDGQQRVTAILNYMADAFPVYGYVYSALPEVDHRGFEFGRVFTRLETKIEDEAELREVYDRLAYGGTPHAPPNHGGRGV